jgi:hypothetical protein
MGITQAAALMALTRQYDSATGTTQERLAQAMEAEAPVPEIVAAFIEAQGIRWEDVGDTVQEYRQYSEQAKREAKAEKTRKEAGELASAAKAKLEEVQAQIAAGADLSHAAIGKAIAKIMTDIEGIRPTAAVHDPFFSYSSYIDAIQNYRHEETFHSSMFHGLPFPKGTTSYIGARTGRGKSAALVNLAREGLNDNKTVLFITLELSSGQLFSRFLLSKQWELGGRMTEDSLSYPMPSWTKPDGTLIPGLALTYWLKEASQEQQFFRDTGSSQRYPLQFRKALSHTKEAITEGRLSILDARGFPLSRILQHIRDSEAAMVMVDYVQKLPNTENGSSEGYKRIQDISQQLVDVSVQSGKIIIAAAQFNRMGTTQNTDDTFTDASFREAGDLEQDAHNAVGIGWQAANKNARFYEVLKARESHHTGQRNYLQWEGAHGFMGANDREYTPPPAEQNSGSGKGRNESRNTPAKTAPEGRLA